ncbi:Protein of unknown function [Malonomonas rubra DSM 5091]|uniref:DUF2845 domain-containing protein n=1 Tax=Malonomonas rubra DSM 5091 TaxID=1122189 RepID=A0A1M6EV49_MALRU|nr:DUF2845 domain-containing protein [Malonomonas rubra]SHI89259.1 Protein of unknown function [Malonomonas rubra DSM 5091]
MKTAFFYILTAVVLSLPATDSFALRCGSKLVAEGDYKYKVLLACGPPVSREVIGYIDREQRDERIRVMKIEEWIIKSNNVYYRLEFEGNVLVNVDWVDRQ